MHEEKKHLDMASSNLFARRFIYYVRAYAGGAIFIRTHSRQIRYTGRLVPRLAYLCRFGA